MGDPIELDRPRSSTAPRSALLQGVRSVMLYGPMCELVRMPTCPFLLFVLALAAGACSDAGDGLPLDDARLAVSSDAAALRASGDTRIDAQVPVRDGGTGVLSLDARFLPDGQAGIALVQYNADRHFGDYDYNRAQLTAFGELAVRQGAKIIVYPEGSMVGYATDSEIWCKSGMTSHEGWGCRNVTQVAEEIPGGKTTSYWADFAQRHDVYVLFSLPEIDQKHDRFYNTVGVVGPQGYIDKYRKRLLYNVDKAYASDGSGYLVFSTPYGDFGISICLDAGTDGDNYTVYKAKAADGVIVVMDWAQDPSGDRAAATFFVERAKNNQIEIFAADVSTWDGTGRYSPNLSKRERHGLPEPAVDIDGVSYHALALD